ncbi:MAG: NrsF family protein [Polyangiaceae bacterium]
MNPSLETLRARIRADLATRRAPVRSEVAWRDRVVLGAGVLATSVAFVVYGGVRVGDRSTGLFVASVGLWVLVAIATSFVALRRGRASLGAPTLVLGWTTALLAPVLVATHVATLFGASAENVPETSARATIACLVATLVMTAGPFGALLVTRRGSDPVHPRTAAAAYGAAAGAWASVLVDLHCPALHVTHVAVGHALPSLLAAAFGAFVGTRVLGIRSIPTPMVRDDRRPGSHLSGG